LIGSALDGPVEFRRGQPLWLRLLSVIGLGRVPMTIIIMTGTLLFGGIGICGNILLGPASFLLSLLTASVGSLLLTGFIARVIGRLIPSTETAAIGRDSLCGKVATVTLGGSRGFAMAHILDEHGTLHQIACDTDSGIVLKAQDKVVVVSHDDATGRFFVAPLDHQLL
jgi:membrane protein implicated in regulation of membrane protease activity